MRAHILLLPALLFLAGCANEPTIGDVDTRIELGDNFYKPSSARANAGDTFGFTNRGNVEHTVTVHRAGDATDKFLKDDELQPGEESRFTFDRDGTYHVFCRYHGSIMGGQMMTVTVGAGSTMSPGGTNDTTSPQPTPSPTPTTSTYAEP